MKKYILSIFAVVLAVGMVAFTAPAAMEDMYVFEYQGNYSDGSVSELENWHFEGINLSMCNNGVQKACRVAVTGDNVDDLNSPTSIADDIIISEGGSGTNRIVTSITGTGSTYSNKSN